LFLTDLAYIHDVGFGSFAERMAPALIQILRRHGIRAGRIVDVGCGSGIVSRHLVDAGYDVVGLDVSPAMIRLARRKVPEATFRVASAADAKLTRCAAVLAIGEVINYVVEPGRGLTQLRAFFTRAHAALPPGGLLVFDFMESTRGRTYAGKSRAGADWAIGLRAEANRTGRIVTRDITTFRKIAGVVRKQRETHRIRIHDRGEISRALTAIGFGVKMRRSYGHERLLPSDVAVVATKPTVRA